MPRKDVYGLKMVQCECGRWFSPLEIVSHSHRCSAFHKQFGAKVIEATYSKDAKVRKRHTGTLVFG